MIDKLKKRLCMPEESYLFPVNKVVAAVLFKLTKKHYCGPSMFLLIPLEFELHLKD